MNKTILFLCFLFATISFKSYSQNKQDTIAILLLPSPKHYTNYSVGLTNPIYRDFATSPLFYSGLGLHLNLAWLRNHDEKERIFEMGMGISAQTASTPQSSLIQPNQLAGFANFGMRYQRLWKLQAWSKQGSNFKIGGAIRSTQNVRGNPSLENNAMGMENFTNLMGAVQWRKDFVRREVKTIDLKLFKLNFKPAYRQLRLAFNFGVLNFNYRPGYAYTYDSEINGTETGAVEWAFANYQWSLNGYRFNTEVEFIKFLSNGNARSISYVWEAAHAPGKFEDFQMASHQLRYTIYFNRKN
ncbi:hypothetical protein [Brumimicrobium aurantiacum]|uniref:Uncharacterized protein n=1 Tax=Brumimicrobium aurantiacum TaxID=1737063 RepID=A0A3E1EYH5_9FLAO|nr:hypothetical protein [Brumimicrobium aurantiacum]RFC54599.1 hypothetical protein DXU93_06315 [Brumimicrobium aurantiacum]